MTHPPDRTPILELVAATAARTPLAVAVLDDEGGELDYAELGRRADALARHLRALGAGPGRLVAVCLPRCLNLVPALLAVWRTGAAYVPLGPDDPGARHAAILHATGAVVVLTDAAHAPAFGTGAARPVVLDPTAWSDLPGSAGPLPTVSPVDTACVLHTSGSTSAPKAVVLSHAGLANRVGWTVREHGLGPADRVLQKTALTFDAAGWEVFAPLVSGGAVVLAAPGAERDPAALVAAVARHSVTVLQVVPSVLRALVVEPGWAACTALRLLFSAGEALHADLVQRFLDAVEPAGGDVRVWNTYGPTECSIDVTAQPVDPAQRTGPIPIGTSISGMRALVADADGLPVPPGTEGELCAAGVGLADGYLGDPALTAQRFAPDPTGPPGSRLYRTGDLARLRADGALEYLGRADHQVKVDGVRIEPGEVEAALIAHPEVLEAAVTPYTAEAGGSTRLAAHLRTRGGAVPGDLRDFLADRLPRSHVPAVFVALAALPTTASGKLDRAALPHPGSGATTASPGAVTLVTGLWRDLLGVADVRAEDDFFALGGSSLQLTQLANRLRAATGAEVDLAALLRATTAGAQAELVTAERQAAEPIRPVRRGHAVPVSAGQRRLWLLDRISPTPREWVSGHFLPVADDLDAAVVQRALDLLVRRHEALRTRFTAESGEPVQLVEPARPVELLRVVAAEGTLGEVVDREAGRGFDLEAGQPVRALLVRSRGGARQSLVLLMHHIVCDGWSAAVLEREFVEVVAALGAGREPDLPELPVQYPDFASWEAARLTQEVLDVELAHWRSTLAGAVPMELRADRPRQRARDARGAVATFTLSARTATALGELAARTGTTLFGALLAGYSTALARHTGQWDVVVGTPVANRERRELEGVVGFFLNNLVLRARLSGDLAFTDAVRAVGDTCRDAFAHQRLPFERLVAELAPQRDLSRTPLYQVAFDLHDERLTGGPAAPEDLAALLAASRIAKTDLTLYARVQPNGSVLGVLEYATALFDHSTIERFGAHLATLLTAAAADPGTALDALPLADVEELRALDASATTPGPAVGDSVVDAVERQAAVTPDAPAVLTDQGALSYAELDARANRLAHLLRGLGVGTDDVVAVLLDRGQDLLVTLLAVGKAGAAYLPLDPAAPPARVASACADCGVRHAVTQRALAAALDGTDLAQVLVDGHSDRISLAAMPADRPDRVSDPELLAYVIQTSGSTGRPKGVAVTRGGLANHVRWAADRLVAPGPGGGALFSSVAFDLVVPNLWAPLVSGRPVRVLPERLDLAELGERLADTAPHSFLKLTPGHLEVLGARLPDERLAALARTVVVAGEVLPPETARRWARLLGPGGLLNEYGPTETTVGATAFEVDPAWDDRPVPIGHPLPGVSARVLGPGLDPQGVDVPGELVVGGVGVARGYVGRPGLTAARFVPDPSGPPGSRAYRTGDLVRRRADGAVEFLGRTDDQVKIRGHRVEPGEVRAALAAHPAVAEAVVVARDDGAGPRLVGYFVPVDPGDDPTTRLRAHLAGLLPEHMVPDALLALIAIPLTANGKVDRAALPWTGVDTPAEATAPRGPVQERVAEVFGELLKRRVGAHTHFFSSGGDSILAIRLIAAIQSAFDVDLPIRAVFEGPTVAELAALVERELRAELDRMTPEELLAESARAESGP
ncbi:amino acid adenylation domain-containing protein [Actinokineospora sp. PR83]|uniref:non-ribosomal peptide synthetase n=1 Tax=Actinokineospora sp. PR83 TaxID=2884908 RepID=UPI001F312D1F|nr:non-ribosomal peptide synthetase [Actinokineospora sp. PR83]MCG8914453.1 amino acid adenylation domain-containing protein [Actinokineospora sp. PR83]